MNVGTETNMEESERDAEEGNSGQEKDSNQPSQNQESHGRGLGTKQTREPHFENDAADRPPKHHFSLFDNLRKDNVKHDSFKICRKVQNKRRKIFKYE